MFAPGSIGNIGPGFDLLGMAVAGIGDTVIARRVSRTKVTIASISGAAQTLPTDPEKNTAGIAAKAVLRARSSREGVELSLTKGVPGSGLGSSAASAVAAAVAVNLLLGGELSLYQLAPLAAEAEEATSGGYFLDNVGASLLGGVVLTNPFTREVLSLGTIPGVTLIVAIPDFRLSTRDSRGVVPRDVAMRDFVWNMAAACGIVAAVAKRDAALFGRSVADRVVEPARAGLIKGFAKVKEAAIASGALGCSIAGAGASLFAVTDRRGAAKRIGEAMRRAFAAEGVSAEIRIAGIEKRGARRVR